MVSDRRVCTVRETTRTWRVTWRIVWSYTVESATGTPGKDKDILFLPIRCDEGSCRSCRGQWCISSHLVASLATLTYIVTNDYTANSATLRDGSWCIVVDILFVLLLFVLLFSVVVFRLSTVKLLFEVNTAIVLVWPSVPVPRSRMIHLAYFGLILLYQTWIMVFTCGLFVGSQWHTCSP